MTSSSFSFRINTEEKKKLEDIAKRYDRTPSYIAKKLIQDYIKSETELEKAIDEAIIESEKGIFVSEKAVDEWVNSWGTDKELPIPKPDIFLNEMKS